MEPPNFTKQIIRQISQCEIGMWMMQEAISKQEEHWANLQEASEGFQNVSTPAAAENRTPDTDERVSQAAAPFFSQEQMGTLKAIIGEDIAMVDPRKELPKLKERLKNALNTAIQALKRNPESQENLDCLAHMHFKLENWKEVQFTCRKLLESIRTVLKLMPIWE